MNRKARAKLKRQQQKAQTPPGRQKSNTNTRRSIICDNLVADAAPGTAGMVVTYEAGHMPDFVGNEASGIAAGARGYVLRVKPGPDHMRPEFVDRLEEMTSSLLVTMSERHRTLLSNSIALLRGADRDGRALAFDQLHVLSSEVFGNNPLSLTLVHWLAGDF